MAVSVATDRNFDSLIANGVCLIDFYTTHCGPCRVLLTKLLELEGKYPFFRLVKVNLDNCPELSKRFLIEFTPTVYLSKDGHLEEYRGLTDKNSLAHALGELYYEGIDGRKPAEFEPDETDDDEMPTLLNSEADNSPVDNQDNTNVKPIIRLNEDKEIVANVKAGLKAKGGYCPCRVEQTPDTKCMCKEFRDQIADPSFEGYCHCLLYYKGYPKNN